MVCLWVTSSHCFEGLCHCLQWQSSCTDYPWTWSWHDAKNPTLQQSIGRFTHSMPCPCCASVVPLTCRATKGLECVFPIWFTHCSHVWFTLARPCSCRPHAMLWPWPSYERHGQSVAWGQHEHGIASVNQTWLHCVNQMGKTHSKPLAAWHGRGTTLTQHGHGMLCVNRPYHTPDDWSPEHTSCSLGVCEKHRSGFWPLNDHQFS